ncbi:MAG: CocE/NonD family hydrolase, partial [Planctomycetes bacterium]|nr:CocE/NonD family hydrolase [Planctomycetota bacterium]
FRGHYTKYEYQVLMRDGTKLFTVVYAPKDASERYPIMLQRTPYSVKPYGVDRYKKPAGMELLLAQEGVIFAYQDVRGRMASEGTFVHVRPHIAEKNGPGSIDESTDTYDTIDWLVKNVPNNNGRVGMRGISYPGFYCAAGMIDAHPALKAVSPQAPVTDWFVGDDWRHNGAFYLAHAFRWFARFGKIVDDPIRHPAPPFDYRTPDGYEFFLNLGSLENIDEKYFKGDIAFWKDLTEHDTYDDFWKERNILNHLQGIRPAVMTVGGWFDAEDLYGPLEVYRRVESGGDGDNILVMGPWAHGTWAEKLGERLGHVDFHAKTSEYYRRHMELPFFLHHLKDGPDPNLPEAFVFETGTNQWRRYNAWPPKNAVETSFYLYGGGKLGMEPPAGSEEGAFDEYLSDPNRPVPYIANISTRMTREHMVDDQRFASWRPDVLVYRTDDLTEDVTVAGPITASLYVSTSGTDSDWVVKLIDVYPGDYPDPDPNPTSVRMGGYQQLVRGEAFRGKFRNSFEKPEPFTPNEVTKIEYTLPDIYHTFRRGHRIMVQIQSSWFPLVDRNPQTFTDIYHASEEDFQKAVQRVYRSEDAASVVRMKVLPRG